MKLKSKSTCALLVCFTGLLALSSCVHSSRFVKRTKNKTIIVLVKADERNISATPALQKLAQMITDSLESKISKSTKCTLVRTGEADLVLSCIDLNYTLKPQNGGYYKYLGVAAYKFSFKDNKNDRHNKEELLETDTLCNLEEAESKAFSTLARNITSRLFSIALYNNYYN